MEYLLYSSFLAKVHIESGLSFLNNFAQQACQPGQSFIGLPTWYKFLPGERSTDDPLDCQPLLNSLSDIWLVVLAVVELMIRIAALAAIIYVIYGGFKFMLARGNPEEITKARMSVINAIVGLIIAVVAVAVVNFIGSSFK